MKFGADIRKDLEGIDKRTALFLWNYEREKLHGIFYGSSSKDVQETTSRKDIFLYEVRHRSCQSMLNTFLFLVSTAAAVHIARAWAVS